MDEQFDIIEYLSGLFAFVFDKAILKRIALERVGYINGVFFGNLTEKQKDLMKADLMYVIYTSPNTWASSTQTHGSYTKTIGGQSLYSEDRERFYNTICSIYKKYNDEKLEELQSSEGSLQWLDY